MNSNSKKILVASLIAVFFIIFGSVTFASEMEEIAPVENMIAEEMQVGEEEMVEPELEQAEGQDVNEEMVESESTDIQAVTIIGTVGEDFVLISKQGIAYGIAETEAGDVMGQYVGEKVIAKGIISVVDDEKFISVTTFDFVEK